MLIDELKAIARDSGVVGAGGAGFPAYAKMTDKADTVILNCVECEPLLKLHRQLLASHTKEILQMLEEVRAAFGAREAVIGIKKEYKATIEALKEVLPEYPGIRLCRLQAAYPMGDEVVLIYEATGRVIRPGGLPIDENVVVYNVETMYNLYRAVHKGLPVTDKLVSVVGEIERPVTLRVPIGAAVKDVVALAGNITVKNPAYLIGGPMMGYPGTENTVITKTTNAIIILPDTHKLIAGINKNFEIERKRASSSCCQCRSCTDMCPRYALGHPIEPHRVMRAVANSDTSDLTVFTNTAFCCGCGICESYACPQGLAPKSIIQRFKSELRLGGIKVNPAEPSSVISDRELRRLPVHRLVTRLGLSGYDVDSAFEDEVKTAARVIIKTGQHIGAPAIAIVEAGESVSTGQKIAYAAEGLSVAVHSSVDGIVESVSDKEIVVTERKTANGQGNRNG